jgi:PAS domain-containing protein
VSAVAEYTIGEVAAMIGFSPHTIRAWERRHNILKPHRTPSGQRRYSAEDVDLLREVINGVVVRGLTLKVAVRAAQGALCLQGDHDECPNGFEMPLPPAMDSSAGVPRTNATALDAETNEVPWRAVADFLPHMIAILDAEGGIVDANVALASASGCLREQLRGARFVDFADPYDRAKAVTAFRPPFQRRRGWELNLQMPASRGLFSFDCIPFRADGQQVLIVIGRDLSIEKDGSQHVPTAVPGLGRCRTMENS